MRQRPPCRPDRLGRTRKGRAPRPGRPRRRLALPAVLLGAALLLLAALPLRATTYYVHAELGDDVNPGTSPQAPWRTLERASQAPLGPGDRLLFAAGCSWRGQLTVRGSGSADRPIVIGAYGSGSLPTISGGEPLQGWSPSPYGEGVWERSLASNPHDPAWLARDGVLLERGPAPGRLRNLQWCYDPDGAVLYLHDDEGNPDATGHAIEAGFHPQALYVRGDHLRIECLRLVGGRSRALYLEDCTDVTLQNLVLERGGWSCLQVRSCSQVVAERLLVHHVPAGCGIWLQDSQASISDAVVRDVWADPAVKVQSGQIQLERSVLAGNRYSALQALQGSAVTVDRCALFANGFNLDWSAHGSNLYADDTSTCQVSRSLLDGYGWRLEHLQQKTVGPNVTLLADNLLNADPRLRSYAAGEGIVCITVDDTDIDYVEQILEALQPYGAPLTFFVIQKWISSKPDYQERLRAVVQAGGEIGCHSYSHPFLAEPTAFSLQYVADSSPARLTIADGWLEIEVEGHPEHCLQLDLTDPACDHTNELIDYLNAFGGGDVFRAVNVVSEAHHGSSHYSRSTDLADLQEVSINQPCEIPFDPDRFYGTQLRDAKLWLEETIGGGYRIATFAAPYCSVDETVRAYLAGYGYLAQRGQAGLPDNLPCWHTRCLQDIYLFGAGTISVKTFHEAGEAWIRALARHLALLGLERGMLLPLLAHRASEFSPEEWAVLADELSRFPGISIVTFSQAAQRIRTSGLWQDVDGNGMRWARRLGDQARYVPLADSPLLAIGAGLQGWVKDHLPFADIDGDGDVDGSDLAALGAAYGSQVGDDAFQPTCELDGDGEVNRGDLKPFVIQFGRT